MAGAAAGDDGDLVLCIFGVDDFVLYVARDCRVRVGDREECGGDEVRWVVDEVFCCASSAIASFRSCHVREVGVYT